MLNNLLIIEDENLLGTELQRHYRRTGWDAQLATSIEDAERILLQDNHEPLVVISDMSLPDGNGLDLLEKMRQEGDNSEWIFLTGYGGVPDSVRALRLGAFDFLTKPCDQTRLDVVVSGAGRSARAQRRLHDESSARAEQYSVSSFVGNSTAARQVRQMLGKLTQVPFSALVINGETGTGKGLAAHILHHAGTRGDGPLVEINCAALPRELLESELFGHEAGAFTGAKGRRRGLMEQAQGGTLFLDEIGEMDLDLQAKLLKAIEERKIRRLGGESEISVDIQILAATNQNLQESVDQGKFRSDLFHRLSVFQLDLPPLRNRKEDLRDLVSQFIAEYNLKAGKRVKQVPDEVWNKLSNHDWPGNVRELRNVVERCVLFSSDEQFPNEWLQLGSAATPPTAGAPGVDGDLICLPLDGSMALDDMDRYIIQTALERSNFNVTATARALGTTRETLRYRVNKYNLLEPAPRLRRQTQPA
jgi:two-component system response regulator AtoC